MKKHKIFISLLFSALIININPSADDNRGPAKDILSQAIQKLQLAQAQARRGGRRGSEDFYQTWSVVGVTADTIVLQRKNKDGETTDEAKIDLSRRPSLKVGDRVRYDKVRDRLRKTLDDEPNTED